MFLQIKNLQRNRKKILGLNERYLNYIRPNNLKSAIEVADDKVYTKKLLLENEIPTPKLLRTIQNREELENIDFDQLPKSFVIKPSKGSKGGGIEIFYNRDNDGRWIRADKSKASVNYLKSHMIDILDGRYSLYNQADIVMLEERVKPHKAFRYHAYKGTPDVRVIVYNNIPVMAMLRLPTEKSRGKANLDQGAIGVGIDMSVGKTTNAVYGKRGQIERVPHTRIGIAGLKIPFWNTILEYSVQASQISNLGFSGVDLLIDRDEGPKIVELNARPGLSIQFANQDGLRRRLRKVDGINVKSIKQGIRIAKDLFGGEIEEGIEAISGKNVIGIYENIQLIGINGKIHNCKAKIDTGADRSSIDYGLAEILGYGKILEELENINIEEKSMGKSEIKTYARDIEEGLLTKYDYMSHLSIVQSSHGISLRISIKVKVVIDETEIETIANIFDRSRLTYPVIIGRKSLYKFLIDPSK